MIGWLVGDCGAGFGNREPIGSLQKRVGFDEPPAGLARAADHFPQKMTAFVMRPLEVQTLGLLAQVEINLLLGFGEASS